MDGSLRRLLQAARNKAQDDAERRVVDELQPRLEATTLGTLLSLPTLHLAEQLETSEAAARLLVELVSTAAAPKLRSALELGKGGAATYLATGIAALDEALNGGIRASLVTELVGRAGSGKTQFCLTMTALESMKGLKVVYIDTEGKFSAERLMEIAGTRGLFAATATAENKADPAQIREFADRVTVMTPRSSVELLQHLEELELIMMQNEVGLIVVDSVAAIARLEFAATSASSLVARQGMLSRIITPLKRLAETYHAHIIVTNQVSSHVGSTSSLSAMDTAFAVPRGEASSIGARDRNAMMESNGLNDVANLTLGAALGNTWAHAVNVRLILEEQGKDHLNRPLRRIRVEKSPLTQEASVFVTITSAGISSTEE